MIKLSRRQNQKKQGGGMGILGWTFIVFLVLKLTDVIAWSWWWVTAPLWGIFALVIGGGLAALFAAGIITVIQDLFAERRRKARIKKNLDLRK